MSTSDGSVTGVTKIVDNGADAQRWNLVILGDGYQASELATYATDAQNFADLLKTTAPFDTLWPAINIHRVDVSSTDSGADDPAACGGTGAAVKTYFDATFCGDGQIQRLLTVNNATARSVATAQVPQMNMTIVIVNSTIYGGSGGQVATFSKAANANEIGIHEMGHTAFGLADEYNYFAGCSSGETGHDTYTGGEPTEPNVTANSSRTTIKWASLIDASTAVPTTSNTDCSKCDPQASPVPVATVGAFEGARYFHCGMFRPQFNCRMNELGNPFCAVCQQAITATLSPFLPASSSSSSDSSSSSSLSSSSSSSDSSSSDSSSSESSSSASSSSESSSSSDSSSSDSSSSDSSSSESSSSASSSSESSSSSDSSSSDSSSSEGAAPAARSATRRVPRRKTRRR